MKENDNRLQHRTAENGEKRRDPNTGSESSENHNWNTKIVNLRKSKVERRWQTDR